MIRVVVDAEAPAPEAVAQAAAVIRAGGVVAFPTDTLYGLAADPFRADAVERVFDVKGRAAARALPLIASDEEQVATCIGPLGPMARRLARAYWPGPLTLLLPAPSTLAAAVTADTGCVGIRVPAHAVARELCRACGHPLTATSANISDEAAPADPDLVDRTLRDRIDLLLDAGRTAGGAASTIVDVTGPLPRLVRAGAVKWSDVQACATGA